MWTIFASTFVGLLLGSAIGGEFSLFGAIAGALVGGYFLRTRQPAEMSHRQMEQRLLQLETSLTEQRNELEMLRRLVVPAAPPAAQTAESSTPLPVPEHPA
ncbi:MAG: hypothetical protein WCC44_01350, partial [Azonexus sp.]